MLIYEKHTWLFVLMHMFRSFAQVKDVASTKTSDEDEADLFCFSKTPRDLPKYPPYGPEMTTLFFGKSCCPIELFEHVEKVFMQNSLQDQPWFNRRDFVAQAVISVGDLDCYPKATLWAIADHHGYPVMQSADEYLHEGGRPCLALELQRRAGDSLFFCDFFEKLEDELRTFHLLRQVVVDDIEP